MRARDFAPLGVSPGYLNKLAAQGYIAQSGRGMYRMPDADFTENHSLVQVAAYSRDCVICLLSALQFHQLTTAMPHVVWLAIREGSFAPQVPDLVTQIVRMTAKGFEAGIEHHVLEGVDVKIYSAAKTVTDCFKFRSSVGMEIAIDALKEGLSKRRFSPADLYDFAVINRVWNVMQPYIEALS
ncbi:transcriptional regulator [Capsulimonas corticalis]|uniref:Transcriptional regulator n=1 Tax=Capsulimonas corticalis TaxID=2219043 RepID=A0A9N7LEE5_9BACT|nr:transcriptional regulator [Capsulimonas corticalis]